MPGILELFALLELGSGLGFLVSRRNKILTAKINYFRQPHSKKSPLDKFIRGQAGRAVTRQDHLRVQLADGLVNLIRTVVQYGAFRELLRALALSRSPLRRRLMGKRRIQPL